jgi:predicted metal-dependent enzyme (double-stranded beta helix superfamily)
MLTERMREFVLDLELLVEAHPQPGARAAAVARELRELLRSCDVLRPEHMEPAPDGYRQHVVHVDPLSRFSVVSLVWLPGQQTPVHDHVCWCVVGVLRGREEETCYELDEAGIPHQRSKNHNTPGEVCWLVPPRRDVHRVRNDGDELAVSIHVYGDDIGKLGTSINRVYSEPTSEQAHSG